MDSIRDVEQHRVTETNPASTNGTLDARRCAALHNHIVERGWVSAGRDLAALNRRSWWDFHGEAAEDIRDMLAPSVMEFLLRIIIGTEEDDWSWHYFLAGVTDPWTMLDAPNDLLQEMGENRFLWMYLYGMPMGHTNGLIFDQVKMLAIIQPTIDDEGVTMNGRQQWLPLETILDAYIDMIDKDKIKAVDGNSDIQYQVIAPWAMLPYSDYDLWNALYAFQELIDAISAQLPYSATEDLGPLADENVVEAANIGGFAKEFLIGAKQPAFKYIAPGIAIQTEDELRKQPYRNIQTDKAEKRPFLLFRASGEVKDFGPVFEYPYDSLEEYPPGLYLNSYDDSDPVIFADGTKFVLPFKIGERGYARASDGELIGGPREDKDKPEGENLHDMLYTEGYNPFVQQHNMQLYRVLENWAWMVTEGHWQVDANGVAGGIEKFREADTKEHGQKYVIPQHW